MSAAELPMVSDSLSDFLHSLSDGVEFSEYQRAIQFYSPSVRSQRAFQVDNARPHAHTRMTQPSRCHCRCPCDGGAAAGRHRGAARPSRAPRGCGGGPHIGGAPPHTLRRCV
eukprot:168707-Chlamydomonas_euryale.AAC.3